MYSFYGGKQGRTYHIVARYDCVNLDELLDVKSYSEEAEYSTGDVVQNSSNYYIVIKTGENNKLDLNDDTQVTQIKGMVQQFSKGGSYTEVNYGQYVIIDTIFHLNQKSNEQNGLLFRRGFDYDQRFSSRPLKEAKENNQYIYYQIQNPGRDDQNKTFLKEKWQAAWSDWVQSPGAGAIYVGQIVGPQGDVPEVIPISWEEFKRLQQSEQNIGADMHTVEPSSTALGKDGEGNFNDTIKVGYFQVKDIFGNLTGCHIAFEIPIHVFEFELNSNPYAEQTNYAIKDQHFKTEDTEIIQNKDYYIRVIDSVTGDVSYQKVTSPIVADLENYYEIVNHPFYSKWNLTVPGGKQGQDFTGITVESGAAIAGAGGSSTDAFGSSVVDNDEYFTYRIKNYQEVAEGTETEHLGIWPYRVIDNITEVKKERSFIASSSAQVGELISFTFNNNTYYAVCIRNGNYNSQTILQFAENPYAGLEFEAADQSPALWRVINIEMSQSSGSLYGPPRALQINYRAGQSDIATYPMLDYVFVDDNGNLYYRTSLNDDLHYAGNLQSIRNTTYQNGTLSIEYTNGIISTVAVAQVTDIAFNNSNYNQRQVFTSTTYVGGSSAENYISKPINTVLAVDRQGDNVIVLYSDPEARNQIPNEKRAQRKTWTDPITNVAYSSMIWHNLGPLGAQYHVQGMYHYSDLFGSTAADDFTLDLSNGFVNEYADRKGWLVTIPSTVDGETFLKTYAYDYNNGIYDITYDNGTNVVTATSHWYEISSLSESLVSPNLTVRVSTETSQDSPYWMEDNLNDNGVWLVVTRGHDVGGNQ